jgi:predicted PurR-regulated permease PerM
MRSVSSRLLGPGVDRYMKTVGDMVHAVVYGVLLTAFLQGLISGIGYRLVGVQPVVLLATLTAFASFIPVLGTLSVIGPVTAVLVLSGQHWPGVLLLVWGVVLVHPIDNLVRPLVVSSVTHMPVLLAMFGVLGGLLAFGLAGIFVGPIALALGLALWKELAAPAQAASGAEAAGGQPRVPGPTS